MRALRRGLLWLACLAGAQAMTGCYLEHARDEDVGPSVFEGRWLIEEPSALYRATLYDLRADGWTEELCSVSLGGPTPVGTVSHPIDSTTCRFSGDWYSRHEGELAIDAFCSDSLSRTVVLYVTWGEDGVPTEVALEKVDGERDWVPGAAWRWIPCARDAAACRVCE